MRAIDFGDSPQAEGEARGYVRALGRSSAYTRGGRPALPRCDGEWGDPEVRVGTACPPNPCGTRGRPMPGCPYVTERPTAPRVISSGATSGTVVVPLCGAHDYTEGESVGGYDLSPSLARDLTEEEAASLVPIPPESVT